MKKLNKLAVVIVAGLLFAMMTTANVFASTSLGTVTAKLINTKTITAGDKTEVNPIKLTETSVATFQDTPGGYVTITIPLEAKLCSAGGKSTGNTGDAVTYTTAALGSSSAPHPLYLNSSVMYSSAGYIYGYASSSGLVGSQFRIMKVYAISSVGNFTRKFHYASSKGMAKKNSQTPAAGVWGTFASIGRDASGQQKVGQIYYDSTVGVVITLAMDAAADTSYLENLYLNGINLIPTTANTTGTVNVTIADGDAAGGNAFGVSASTAGVATLVTQAANIEGSASGVTPPTIPTGKVSGQPSGRLKITLVGGAAGDTNALTIALDNGAKFYSGTTTTTLAKSLATNCTSYALDIAGTPWSTYRLVAGASLTVNTSGQLVLALGSHDRSNAEVITIPASTNGVVIDAENATAGSITATVSGSGPQLAGVTGTAVLANAQAVGTTVSFKDDTTAGYSTLYTGRKSQTIGTAEKIQITESAPTSLLSGGSVIFGLNLGAKFGTSSSLTGAESTDSGYTDTSLVISSPSITTANASATGTVTAQSATSPGTYYFTAGTYDLTGTTSTGPLMLTVSGTAGASGSITLANVLNATTTTVASPITLVPGNTVAIPDITITENKAGALIAGKIGFKFPTGFTLSSSGVTVTTTAATTGASTAVTFGAVDAADATYCTLNIASASTSSTGLYTIVVSGLTATTTSSISSGSTSFQIGGVTSDTYSTALTAGFDSNHGAKATKQSVVFGSTVSATVPFADTPVVSGTAVTQTFIPAGNDIGKVGDVYVFTTGQYWTGSAWTATETPYSAGATLGSMTVTYNVGTLTSSGSIYIGYGVGLTGTNANMNTNATFVKAYTFTYTPPTIPTTGTAAGATTVTQALNDDIGLYLNITNDDGVSAPAQEWLVFGAIVGNVDAGLFFFTPAGAVVPYEAGLDLSTVTYAFDHTSDTLNVATLNMGTLGLAAGDTFWYAYVYAATAIDLADPTSYSVENSVIITAQ